MGEGSGATEPHPIKGLGGGRVWGKRWFARAGVGRETEMLKNLWGPQLSGAKPLEKHWFSKENWWMAGGGGGEPGGTATPN